MVRLRMWLRCHQSHSQKVIHGNPTEYDIKPLKGLVAYPVCALMAPSTTTGIRRGDLHLLRARQSYPPVSDNPTPLEIDRASD